MATQAQITLIYGSFTMLAQHVSTESKFGTKVDALFHDATIQTDKTSHEVKIAAAEISSANTIRRLSSDEFITRSWR